MFDFLKKLFRRKPPKPQIDEAAARKWDEQKSKLMVGMLGPQHQTVMHSIVPYEVGGALDLYYYTPPGTPGTAIATKELSLLPEVGPSNRAFAVYEIAMFTRQKLNLDDAKKESTPFGKAHANLNSIMNHIARFTEDATLNPYETCEFPQNVKHVGGKCLLFDAFHVRNLDVRQAFGILAVIEVHRSEMDYARSHGGAELIKLLKAAGHYPYSDLERRPVV